MALIVVRSGLDVAALMILWVCSEGLLQVLAAPWIRGITVGGVGFGISAVLLLVGQKMSDPVTPAIAAAMMPIAGAAVEVVFDKRRLHLYLIIAIVMAFAGGLLAGGVNLSSGTFDLDSVFLCVLAIFLFAWVTRATTPDFKACPLLGRP